MADFVGREKIQEAISDIYKDADSAVEGACIEIWSRVKEISSANVRPVVSATWYDDGLYGMIEGRFYSCPVCKAQNVGKSNFCPNCGADMREVTINGN